MVVELPCRVGVLARPAQIAQAHTVDEGHVARMIGATRSLYPYVVIDLPRKLDAVTGCAIESCDKLIIIVQLNFASIHNAWRLADALVNYGLSRDKIEFVVNRYRKGSHAVTVDTLESRVGRKVLGVLPNHFKALAAAMDTGQPVTPKNPVRKGIEQIASRLCAQPVETA
jgi:pilus assembly protein CpaE